jgi:hypothetical protein
MFFLADTVKCTVMLNVLCKRDCCVVEMYLVWPIWSRNLGPSTLSTYPPPPGLGSGDSVYWQPSRRKDLDSEVEIRSQPNTNPVLVDNVCNIIFISFRKLFLKCLSNDWLSSTDCRYIFRLINHNKK